MTSSISLSHVLSAINSRDTSQNNTALNENQLSTLNDILANYDPNNMSEGDYMALGEELKDSGLKPNRSLMSAISEAGFSMPQGGLQGAGGPPPQGGSQGAGGPPPQGGSQGAGGPPPQGGSQGAGGSSSTDDSSDYLSLLEEILAEYDSENMSNEDYQSLIGDLQDANIAPSVEVMKAVEDAGFDLPKSDQTAYDVTNSTKERLSSSRMSSIIDSIKQFEEGVLSKKELDKILNDANGKGYETKGIFIDSYETSGSVPTHVFT